MKENRFKVRVLINFSKFDHISKNEFDSNINIGSHLRHGECKHKTYYFSLNLSILILKSRLYFEDSEIFIDKFGYL